MKTSKSKVKKCDHGFHGSLHEELTGDLCPKCRRNLSDEEFLDACCGLGIDPSVIVGKKVTEM